MAMPSRPWSLSIGGVDQTARIERRTIKGSAQRNGFANLSFNTFDVAIGSGAFRSALDAEVLFTYDGVLRYRGMISEVADQPLGGIRSGTRQSIKCMDYASLLDRVIITGSAHDYSGNPQAILWSGPFLEEVPVPVGMIPVRLHAPHNYVTGDWVRISGHYVEPPDPQLNGDYQIVVPANPTGDYWIGATFFVTHPPRTTMGGAGEVRRIFTMKMLITDIVATFLTPNYGITLDMSMPDGPWLESMTVTGATVNEALRQLSATTGWLYRVLPTKVLEVFVPGTKLAPFNLDGSTTNAPIQWQSARQRFTNRVVVIAGGTQKIVATETFVHTGGPAAVYQAAYPASQDINDAWPALLYVNNEVWGPVGFGPLQLPSPSWYWDPATSRLVEEDGANNPPAGSVLSITYARQYPVIVTAEDPIDVQPPPVGRGPWENRIEAPEILDRGQAQGLANNMLAQKFSEPRSLQTGTYAGYATPGDRITLAFPDRVVASSPWLVESISWEFAGPGIMYFNYTFVEGQTSLKRDAEDEFVVQGNWITDFQELLAAGNGAGGVQVSTTGGGGLPTTPPTGGGGGTEEVSVGASDPGPTLELWYDTDEPAPDTTIPDHSITFRKIVPIDPQTVLGRSTAGIGDIEVLTVLPTSVQNNITRLGTIVSGVWHGTPIGLTFLAGAGAAGTFVQSNGTNWATSTLLLPNAATVTRVVYATAPNTYGESANLTFDGSNLRLVGNQTVSGFIGSPSYASQTTGWRIDAAGGADFRYMFVDEMHAKSFITDLEMALAGGQIISKSVAMVAAPFTVPGLGASSELRVRDLPSAANVAAFQDGDTVVLRKFSRTGGALTIADCVGQVFGWIDQADGTQSWTFYRNFGAEGGSMSGGVVEVDSLALDYGISGNGYYEVNAIDGANGIYSPYAQIVTWTNAPTGSNRTIRARFGNLRGITGVTNEYGLIAGTYVAASGSYLRASNQTFELHNVTAQWWAGFTPVVVISPGNGSPYISLGNPAYPAIGQGPGVMMAYNAAAGLAQFWCYSTTGANYFVFDGNLLYWRTPTTILDTNGNLTANNASLSGSITATSGSIVGDFVIGQGGQIRSGAQSFSAGIGWWLDYNSGVPRFRVGHPQADRLSWDGGVLTVRSGKLLIDGSAGGHIGMGAAPYSIATLNIASDTDDASTYGLLVTNHSGTVATLLSYGDGRLFLGGQLYIMPGAWDTTGQNQNPPSIWNGPFGTHELSGWMRVYMHVGGGGGIPPTGPYSRGWIPVWLG